MDTQWLEKHTLIFEEDIERWEEACENEACEAWNDEAGA